MNIRVSCSGLCKIQINEKFLLVVNPKLLKSDDYVLTPIGGALKFTDLHLTETFELELENPQEPQELRFYLDSQKLEAFREWFVNRKGRETNPFRELFEELVLESNLLSSLSSDDVRFSYHGMKEVLRESKRPHANGVLTHTFIELYTVTFVREDHLATLENLQNHSWFRWVTRQQIEAGRFDQKFSIEASVLLDI